MSTGSPRSAARCGVIRQPVWVAPLPKLALTADEVEYLSEVLGPTSQVPDLGHRLRAGQKLTVDEIDLLRDECGERLQQVGFDEHYVPTSEGRVLETLIDKLFIDG